MSGSSDSCIIMWSIVTMSMTEKYRGHSAKINQILCIGSVIFSSAYDRLDERDRLSIQVCTIVHLILNIH